MHSRIIELSKDPILKHERMCESSVPDWFYHSIADYTDADTDRDHDIKWFLDAVARVVDVAEDGKSFTFKPKAKQKYFERQYHAFLDKACELTGISLDAFVGEAKYDIGMAMYKCVALSAVYRKKEDEVAKERRTKAEAEERAFCEEQNRLSEQAVQEAIRTIKDGGVLQNQTVKFYRSRYRCNAFSIVNYLMRKYGVNVPLRTQGWINEKLTSVTIENGKCEHLRYMRAKGAQCSQRFFDCMSELIHNVCAETEG